LGVQPNSWLTPNFLHAMTEATLKPDRNNLAQRVIKQMALSLVYQPKHMVAIVNRNLCCN
jgi:hypothetical protein